MVKEIRVKAKYPYLSEIIAKEDFTEIRESYLGFLSGTDNLATEYQRYLDNLRKSMGVSDYKMKPRDSPMENPPLDKMQDVVSGALRLVGNMSELDSIIRGETEPSEQFLEQYLHDKFLIGQLGIGNSPGYREFEAGTRNDYGDTHFDICLEIPHKDIKMGYDSNTHYIAQFLNDMSVDHSHKDRHLGKMNLQVRDGSARIVYRPEQSTKIKANPAYDKRLEPDDSQIFDPLPKRFQVAGGKLIEQYNELFDTYLRLTRKS
tara:strand:- start:526 stop:1308 length:783 start_codon:yes stop_codon:yes gene_type:complete